MVLAACLVFTSILTIGSASAVIGWYNGPIATITDTSYTIQSTYLALACVGVILGLYAMMYPDFFVAYPYLLPLLIVVWWGVTIASTVMAQNKLANTPSDSTRVPPAAISRNNTPAFIVNYLMIALVFALFMVGLFMKME